MEKSGKRIPITMTQGADAKSISDAIGEFLEKYDAKRAQKDDDQDDQDDQE